MVSITDYKFFKPGVYAFCGGQGAGKTSLAVLIARLLYKHDRKKDVLNAQGYVDIYNRVNGLNLRLSSHIIYTNFDVFLDKKRDVHGHYIDTTCFGLPNSEYSTVHFPFGSTIILDEADTILTCKDARFRRYIVSLLKYARHNGLRLIFICQSFSSLQKRIRDLIQYVVFFKKSKISKFFGFIFRIKWRFDVLDNFEKQFLDIKHECGCPVSLKEVKSCFKSYKLKKFCNVFKYYDSHSGRVYFFKNLKTYEFIKQPIFDFSKESIDNYIKMHPLSDID